MKFDPFTFRHDIGAEHQVGITRRKEEKMENLKAMSFDFRKDIVDMIMSGKGGHIGGDMSVLDILIELYYEQMNISPENMNCPDRDRFVMSKGHAVEALYTVLAHKGFFPIEEVIEKFSKFGSPYIGHPNNKLPGIEMNSGSLGHGLPVSVGMALAGKMDKRDYRVYTVMGDGEIAEGSVWEAFMAGGHYKLDNLCAVIDLNGLQISGTTDYVMNHREVAKQVADFGWHVIEVDGHDYAALRKAFDEAKVTKGMPTCLIAHTTKGYGAAIMENKAGWHHHLPNQEEYEEIIAEFAARKEEVLK